MTDKDTEQLWYIAVCLVAVVAVGIGFFYSIIVAMVFWIVATLILCTLRPD